MVGKTEAMIMELLDSVREGQPRSIVVAHTEAYARCLQTRVASALERQGESIQYQYSPPLICVDGVQTIEFMGVSRATARRTVFSHRGTGWFWDNSVFDKDHYCKLRDTFDLIDSREGIKWEPS